MDLLFCSARKYQLVSDSVMKILQDNNRKQLDNGDCRVDTNYIGYKCYTALCSRDEVSSHQRVFEQLFVVLALSISSYLLLLIL
ncbi:hypothetical protein D3C86_1676640 [compost metagenome]